MKKITIVLILLISIASCELLVRDHYNTYNLLNETNHEIQILGYGGRYKNVDTITIEKKGSYQQIEIISRGLSHWDFLDSDSVIMIFDKEREFTYFPCPITNEEFCWNVKSPLNYGSYVSSHERKNGIEFTYTITEDDYENAALIVKE